MNAKMSKRQRDLKAKLMAAIAMLLVSSIMMVSTTYAWFTLSTAPEVTGITTAVGANGNLEMALQPGSGDLSKIGTTTGDSNQPDAVRNETWGNLVDLSDNNTYGLNEINLYPAALNLSSDEGAEVEKLNIANMLSYPEYGADGRIKDLNKTGAVFGEFNTQAGTFVPGTTFGVRAVGAASGMTNRQLTYRSALNLAASKATDAAMAAKKSLDNNGGGLASIAIKYGADGDKAKFDETDKAAIQAMLDDLTAANGPFSHMREAYKQYILAMVTSSQSGLTDAAADLFVNNYEKQDLNTVLEEMNKLNLPMPTGFDVFTAGIDAMEASYAKIAEAQEDLNSMVLQDGENGAKYYAKNDIFGVLSNIANPDRMKIGDKSVDQFKQIFKEQGISGVLGMFGNGVTITMMSATETEPSSGVYADIAAQTENYTANVEVTSDVMVMGMSLKGLKAKMTTDAETHVLPNVGIYMASKTSAPESGTGDSVLPITDTYGYVIDMAFKTNAAGSKLLLQPDAVNRIYTGQDGMEMQGNGGQDDMESTMGTGASMTFTAGNNFSNEQMKNLMDCIVVVFYETKTGNIIGYAKLDTANATSTADGLKAKLMMAEKSKTDTTVTRPFSNEVTQTNVTYTVYYTNATLQTPVYRSYIVKAQEGVEGSVDETKWEKYVPATEGTDGTEGTPETWTALDAEPTDIPSETKTVKAGSLVIKTDSNAIMDMPQNTAVALSALVYLDGENVTNADVATSGSSSMSGKMSLQFSSNATLTPMNYTPLMGDQDGSVSVTSTPIATVGVAAADGHTLVGTVTASGSFKDNGEVTIDVTGLGDQVITGVSVNGTAVASPTISGAKVTFVNESVKADSTVTVTVGPKPASTT